MGDFPNLTSGQGSRGVLSPAGATPLGNMMSMAGLGFSITTSTWTQNRAVYMPVLVEEQVTVTDMAIYVVTQNGNVDTGIYDFSGNLLVRNGGVACAAAGVQVVSITDTPLSPGWYYIAFSSDSASVAVFRSSTIAAANARVCGVREQASAYPLPTPSATFAAYATAVMPLVIGSYSATF